MVSSLDGYRSSRPWRVLFHKNPQHGSRLRAAVLPSTLGDFHGLRRTGMGVEEIKIGRVPFEPEFPPAVQPRRGGGALGFLVATALRVSQIWFKRLTERGSHWSIFMLPLHLGDP